MLLFATGTALALAWISARWDWPPPGLLAIGSLPFMVLMAANGYLDHNTVNPLANLGFLAWPAAFSIHYFLLKHNEDIWPERVVQLWHSLSLWLATFLLAQILAQWLDGFRNLSAAWPLVAWAVVPASVVLFLTYRGDKLRWPIGRFGEEYRGTGLVPLILFLLAWTLVASAYAGDPAPLPYLPLINPLDLAQAFALLMVFAWYRNASSLWPAVIKIDAKIIYGTLGVIGFVWFNAMIARTVHFMGKVPYRASSMFDSNLFQSSASIVWSLGAMGLMILANRKRWRILWYIGAGLLALVVVKLFLIDLAGTGTVARIISFLAVGILMLAIGYLSPLPPKAAGTEE
jgi:uncharacterized membrane protein